jgi:hypothetical protein
VEHFAVIVKKNGGHVTLSLFFALLLDHCVKSHDVVDLQTRHRPAAIEDKYKGKKILLGIYLYDFYNRRPVSNEMMELQCNYALELLKEGRIDGMIFEANSTMGVQLPSEYWLRDWIKQVKYTEIPD